MQGEDTPRGFWRGILEELKHVWMTRTGKFLLLASSTSLLILIILVAFHTQSWYEGAVAVISALFVFFTLSALLETPHFTRIFRSRLKDVVDQVLMLNPNYLKTIDQAALLELREALLDRLVQVTEGDLKELMRRVIKVEERLLTAYRKEVQIERIYDFKDNHFLVNDLITFTAINPLLKPVDFPIRKSVLLESITGISERDLFSLTECTVNGRLFVTEADLHTSLS